MLFCGELVEAALQTSVKGGSVKKREMQAAWQGLKKAAPGIGSWSMDEFFRCWVAASEASNVSSSTCSSPASVHSPPLQCCLNPSSQLASADANQFVPAVYRQAFPSLHDFSNSDFKHGIDPAPLERAIFLQCSLAARVYVALILCRRLSSGRSLPAFLSLCFSARRASLWSQCVPSSRRPLLRMFCWRRGKKCCTVTISLRMRQTREMRRWEWGRLLRRLPLGLWRNSFGGGRAERMPTGSATPGNEFYQLQPPFAFLSSAKPCRRRRKQPYKCPKGVLLKLKKPNSRKLVSSSLSS